MLKPTDRLAILLHGGLLQGSGKTGLSLLRYGDSPRGGRHRPKLPRRQRP